MDNFIEHFWTRKIEDLKEALETNNFTVRIASDAAEAKRQVIEEIVPAVAPKTISFGGSASVMGSGVYAALKELPGVEILDTYEYTLPHAEMYERRRQALLVDLFVTGTSAVTTSGILVNLDMIGNRTGAINFGPKHVVLIVGRNKICEDLDAAMLRVKSVTAPANAMRLDKKTPCVKSAVCMDCKSPERICNVWTITEKCFPKGRITVILVNQELGF